MKILHITYGFNGGGVGFVVANYCANQPMPGITFDIVGESIGKPHLLQERFEKAGFHTFYVTPKKQSLLKNIKEMRRVIQQGHYDAVHVHFEEWSFLYLWIAKLCGVKVRVCHAHMAYMTGASAKPHYRLFRMLLNRFATLRLACSKDAGDHLYGKHPYTVLKNAIEAEKYVYHPETRRQIRTQMGLTDKFVVGVVGRLTYQKNPQFTVEIFAKVKEKRPNAVLMFVGQGELEEEIRRLVQAKGLTDSVLFLGGRESSTIKEISENWLGKATISMQTEGRSRGQSESYSQNTQRLGRELMTPSELATMPGDRCILQLRGLPPFYSKKYDLKQHPNYKYTAEADKVKNAFDLNSLVTRRMDKLNPNETYTVYKVDVPDEAITGEDEDILNYDDLDDPDAFV